MSQAVVNGRVAFHADSEWLSISDFLTTRPLRMTCFEGAAKAVRTSMTRRSVAHEQSDLFKSLVDQSPLVRVDDARAHPAAADPVSGQFKPASPPHDQPPGDGHANAISPDACC